LACVLFEVPLCAVISDLISCSSSFDLLYFDDRRHSFLLKDNAFLMVV